MSSIEKKLRIYDAAEMFMQHKQEILHTIRKAPRGSTVFAAVDGNGTWLGTGQVTPDTLDFLARNEESGGYAIALDPVIDKTDIAVSVAIEQWLEETLNEAEEEAE